MEQYDPHLILMNSYGIVWGVERTLAVIGTGGPCPKGGFWGRILGNQQLEFDPNGPAGAAFHERLQWAPYEGPARERAESAATAELIALQLLKCLLSHAGAAPDDALRRLTPKYCYVYRATPLHPLFAPSPPPLRPLLTPSPPPPRPLTLQPGHFAGRGRPPPAPPVPARAFGHLARPAEGLRRPRAAAPRPPPLRHCRRAARRRRSGN
eukprot:1189313-Prorocentrum_minimum.AAC.2